MQFIPPEKDWELLFDTKHGQLVVVNKKHRQFVGVEMVGKPTTEGGFVFAKIMVPENLATLTKNVPKELDRIKAELEGGEEKEETVTIDKKTFEMLQKEMGEKQR